MSARRTAPCRFHPPAKGHGFIRAATGLPPHPVLRTAISPSGARARKLELVTQDSLFNLAAFPVRDFEEPQLRKTEVALPGRGRNRITPSPGRWRRPPSPQGEGGDSCGCVFWHGQSPARILAAFILHRRRSKCERIKSYAFELRFWSSFV